MGYDKSYHQTGMMAYARILVYMDTRGGLYEYITIQWRDTARRQIIDYEGIPYRCRRCHKVGHLYRDCPLLRKSQRTVPEEDADNTRSTPLQRSVSPYMPQQHTQAEEAPQGEQDPEPACNVSAAPNSASPSSTKDQELTPTPPAESALKGNKILEQTSSPKRQRTD